MKWKLKFKIISCNNLATYFNNKEGNNINKCDIKRLIDLITQKLSFPKQNLTKKKLQPVRHKKSLLQKLITGKQEASTFRFSTFIICNNLYLRKNVVLTPKKAKFPGKNYVKTLLFHKGTWRLPSIFTFSKHTTTLLNQIKS